MRNCPQEWNKMIDVDEQKRFCKSCQKCVYDFTKLTVLEIEQKVNNLEKGFCCRIDEDKYQIVKRKLNPEKPTRKFFKAASLFLGLFLGTQNADAQTVINEYSNNEKLKVEYLDSNQSENFVITGHISKTKRRSYLKVHKRIAIPLNNKTKGIKSAKIEIFDAERNLIKTIVPNNKGEFSIEFSKALVGKEFSLKIYIDDEVKTHLTDLKTKNIDVVFELFEYGKNYKTRVITGRYF